MEKTQITINILPKTKEKLELIKESTGLTFGSIMDMLVEDYIEDKKADVESK